MLFTQNFLYTLYLSSLIISFAINFGLFAQDDMSRACANGFCIDNCPTQFTCPPCPPCQNCIPTCILSGSFMTDGSTNVVNQSGSNFIVTISSGIATVLFSPFSTIVTPTISNDTGAIISLQSAPTTKSFTFTVAASTTYYFVVTPAT